MKFSTAFLFSALAAAVSALTPPDYEKFPEPTGNPIFTPGLNEVVPVGESYAITWNPTTDGKVSLQLLRGPSNNVVPIGVIAESIDNIGYYHWTPDADLEPDTSRYGILLTVEGTGQYQYSTQFGIENDNFTPPDESPSAPDTEEPEPTDSATESPSETASATTSATVSLPPKPTHSVPIRTYTSTYCDCEDETTSAPVAPTGVIPTMSKTTTYLATPTPSAEVPSDPSSPPDFDNAAGRNTVGLFGGAVVAMAAILVF